jgi:hypothetical protein
MRTFFGLASAIALLACSSSSNNTGTQPRNDAGVDGATTPAGGCSGDVTACALGSLSDAQRTDVCNLILTAIDAPSGAKYECTSGPNEGRSLTVNSKDACIAQRFPATCAIKVGELIECYKAAKADACSALGDEGTCTPIFSQASTCASAAEPDGPADR